MLVSAWLTLPTLTFKGFSISLAPAADTAASGGKVLLDVLVWRLPADRFTCKKSVEHPSTEHSSSPAKTSTKSASAFWLDIK